MAIPKPGFLGRSVGPNQVARLMDQPTQHARRIIQQTAIGGIMNVALDHRTIDPQTGAGRDPCGLTQLHDLRLDQPEGLGVQQGLAIPNRPKIGHGLLVQLTHPTPARTGLDFVRQDAITPAHQAPRHRQAPRHHQRQGVTTLPTGLRVSGRQIMPHRQLNPGVAKNLHQQIVPSAQTDILLRHQDQRTAQKIVIDRIGYD
jgi:hypothetical protein